MTDFISIVMIAFALAMDAFAVSITSGISINKLRLQHAILIASFFGIFQACMPVLGWLAGKGAIRVIRSIDHWIAFGLLVLIGGKMIIDALIGKDKNTFDPLKLKILVFLAISTSIDAFAIGITFSLLDVNIITPVIIIGLITFFLSFIGTYIGKLFGHIFEKKLEIIGGLILIGIGTKILIEHLFFQNL